jgi:hypothetical protein
MDYRHKSELENSYTWGDGDPGANERILSSLSGNVCVNRNSLFKSPADPRDRYDITA